MPRLEPDDMTRFGVTPEDEHRHPYAPNMEAWNESIFFDWRADDGDLAGHCRIGVHPGQDRLWLWLFLYDGDGWLAIEEPRLDLSRLDWDAWSFEQRGLSFSRDVIVPLLSNRLRCQGFARVLDGPRAGMILPVSLDLRFDAAGPAHGMATRAVKGADGATYGASRFEQPMDVEGEVTIAGRAQRVQGKGERDHSWGPRVWDIAWTFLVLLGDQLRAQCTEVIIGGKMRICVGYVQQETMVAVQDARFDLTFYDDTPAQPFEGTICATSELGELRGHIRSETGVEIDMTHSLEPPRRPVYRRALVQFEPADGGPTIPGWMECNRFPDVPASPA